MSAMFFSKVTVAALGTLLLLLVAQAPAVEAGGLIQHQLAGPIVTAREKRASSLDVKKSNHTKTKSLTIPITVVSGSQGQFTAVLEGNSYAYFEIPTGRNAALNVVVALDTFLGNCDNTVVNVKLESTLPEVDGHSDSSDRAEKTTDGLSRAIMSLLQSSIFCLPRPELAIRVRDTGDSPKYYLLLETTLSDGADSSSSGSAKNADGPLCVVQTFYDFEDVSSFRTRMYTVSAVLLLATVAIIVKLLWVLRTPGFDMFHANASPSAFLMFPLIAFRNVATVVVVVGWKKLSACIDKRRAERRAARQRREEAALLTPTAAASSSGGGASILVASPTVLPDEDEDSCRICKEGAEGGALIRPCKCSGSCKFVHRECLDRWRIESLRRNQQNSTHCEICKAPFTIDLSRATRYGNLAKRFSSYFLLAIGAYLLIIATSVVARGTVGELSCLAPYHTVANGEPFSFSMAALGCFCYLIGGSCVFYVHHYCYLVFRNDPVVRAHVAAHHLLPPFMTWRMALRVACGCLVPLSLFVAAGYWIKIIFYQSVQYSVWNWEISPFMGLLVAIVVGVFSVAVLATSTSARRLEQREEEEAARQRAAEIDEALQDDEPQPPQDADTADALPEAQQAATAAVVVVTDRRDAPPEATEDGETGSSLQRADTAAAVDHHEA